jgi:tRNA(Ile)-lysidine synthase
LHLLSQISAERHLRLEAAYFDHEIRSKEERVAELGIVRRIGESLRIPLHTGNAPVATIARSNRRSVEDQARIERYRFLKNVANASACTAVAVGHTADDQAESILMHILRGSGLRGLAGMEERQSWPFGSGPILIRPLLSFRRAETAAYCMAHGITTHCDSENELERYQRNKVRIRILPAMQEVNPRAVEAITRLGESAREQLQFIDGMKINESGLTVFARSTLAAMPAALRSQALIAAHAALAEGRRALTRRHILAINGLLEAYRERQVDLPGNVRAVSEGAMIRFERAKYEDIEPKDSPSLPLEVPGTFYFGDWEITTCEIQPLTHVKIDSTTAVFSREDANKGLKVRGWRRGDRIEPAGMLGRKKLQDLFVDLKVPRRERNAIPVICVEDEPVWVVGVRADERARCADVSLHRILISACKLDGGETATIG